MAWVFRNVRDAFDSFRDRWDELNNRCGNHILLDSIFVGSLIRHFASDGILLGVSEDQDDPGLVILHKVRPGFWETFQPSQGPLGLITLGNGCAIEEQMARLIRCLPGCSLGFSVTQQDPDFTVLQNLNLSRKIETVNYIDTPRITLSGTFEQYWRARGRDLTRNLTRRLRRATEEGTQLELITVQDPGGVVRCVQ